MERQPLVNGSFSQAMGYWDNFVAKSIAQRLEAERFERFVKLVYEKHPLPGILIADLFLRPGPTNRESLDPRIPPFVSALTKLGYVDATAILKALYRYSSSQKYLRAANQQRYGDPIVDQAGGKGLDGNEEDKTSLRIQHELWENSYWAEEHMFYFAIKLVVDRSSIQDSRAILELLHIMCKWTELLTITSNALTTEMLTGLHDYSPIRGEMEASRAAFIPLLIRLVDTPAVLDVLSKGSAKKIGKKLSAALTLFLPTFQPPPPFVTKLERFRIEVLAAFDPVDKKANLENAAVQELLDSTVGHGNFEVQDILIPNTRAGLYIHINASLVGRPMLDDTQLMSYLNIRYQGDVQTGAIDLILASFDCIENAVSRNEGARDAQLLKSYLINKVPLLLAQLCPPAFSANAAEFAISEALRQVDTSMFPTASLMFDESRNNNPYTESVREEFCAACALHGLIEREHVDRILGERSLSYDTTLQRHSKEKLVQDCLSDSDKIQGLVRELEKMDGNVGVVCQVVVELIRQLSLNKETMTLKQLCVQLVAKSLFLDILLLFEKPSVILEPLCHLLENWQYEEDQGEYQPVYEEFGGILLLVLAFSYRYNLSPSLMGVQNQNSSVGKIVSQAHFGRHWEDLSEEENKHLGGWINGLFDSEAGGLGDDLMSSCLPQDFYLMVSTLFQNIVMAYTQNALNDETLKSGIEYLIDTFLLPSLVPAIHFLSGYLKIDNPDQNSIIKVLQLILLPSSISGEASIMLASVKNLIAKPLEHALRSYQRKDPKNQDIEPLLSAITENLKQSRRLGGADTQEVESWINSSSSGLTGALKHTISNLIQWSMHPGANSSPTSYTHRQVNTALEICGSKRVLAVILDEVRQQSEAGADGVAHDVATALICAPNATTETSSALPLQNAFGSATTGLNSSQRCMQGLRDALRAEADDCRKIQKTNPLMADIIVRLHRRVEMQLTPPATQTVLPDANMTLGLDSDQEALNHAMAAAGVSTVVQGDGLDVDGSVLDMGDMSDMGGLPDLTGLGGASVTGDLDGGGGDDIFGGLDTTDMDFEGWGNMEGMDMT